jgi:hypothetical protein
MFVESDEEQLGEKSTWNGTVQGRKENFNPNQQVASVKCRL